MILWFAAGVVVAGEGLERQKLANWHQWRGPQANGFAPQGKPPVEWSTTKNVKWKIAIPGRGSASPIVWGDRIFILTAIKTDRTAEPPQAEKAAAAGPQSALRFVSDTATRGSNSAVLLAQRDDAPADGARDNDSATEERPERGRRGPGGFRGGPRGSGGFGRGFRGGRIESPTNFYQFVVLCIDRKSGQTIWQRTAAEIVPHEGHHQTGSFASASAVTDGKRLIAPFGSRGIHCYDLEGNPQWNKDLGDMKTRMSFGEGSTPALFGDTLVQPWDQEGDSFIVALDARTGDEKWRQPRDEVSTWATPLIVEAAGRTQVVTSGTNRIRSYDLETGEIIWECGGLGSNPIASPVVVDGLAICMTGHHDPAGIAVPLDSKGDVTDSEKIAWQIEEVTPYVPSPVVYEDTIYFTKSRNAILSSIVAKTGKPIIDQKRLPGLDSIYASPVAADGRIYICSREGATIVLKHGPTLDILATNELNETIDASPAIVGKDLIIRTEGNLYCIAAE
jgi:outer membrane protein assembly factor BamB